MGRKGGVVNILGIRKRKKDAPVHSLRHRHNIHRKNPIPLGPFSATDLSRLTRVGGVSAIPTSRQRKLRKPVSSAYDDEDEIGTARNSVGGRGGPTGSDGGSIPPSIQEKLLTARSKVAFYKGGRKQPSIPVFNAGDANPGQPNFSKGNVMSVASPFSSMNAYPTARTPHAATNELETPPPRELLASAYRKQNAEMRAFGMHDTRSSLKGKAKRDRRKVNFYAVH